MLYSISGAINSGQMATNPFLLTISSGASREKEDKWSHRRQIQKECFPGKEKTDKAKKNKIKIKKEGFSYLEHLWPSRPHYQLLPCETGKAACADIFHSSFFLFFFFLFLTFLLPPLSSIHPLLFLFLFFVSKCRDYTETSLTVTYTFPFFYDLIDLFVLFLSSTLIDKDGGEDIGTVLLRVIAWWTVLYFSVLYLYGIHDLCNIASAKCCSLLSAKILFCKRIRPQMRA